MISPKDHKLQINLSPLMVTRLSRIEDSETPSPTESVKKIKMQMYSHSSTLRTLSSLHSMQTIMDDVYATGKTDEQIEANIEQTIAESVQILECQDTLDSHKLLNEKVTRTLGKFIHWNFRLRSMLIMKILLPIFTCIHWLAKRHVTFAMAPIFLYTIPENYLFGITLTILPTFTTNFCSMLKDILMIPRPKWFIMRHDMSISDWAVEKSFSTPSNHSAIFAAIGTISMIHFEYNWYTVLITICLIISTMLSRMYLMVHYAHDVIIGALIAIVLSFPLYYANLIEPIIGSRYWLLTLIWGIGYAVLNYIKCKMLAKYIESHMPDTRLLETFAQNAGYEDDFNVQNFFRFRKTSWYYVVYVAMAVFSIDLLVNVSGFSIKDGKLWSPNDEVVNIQTVGWIGSFINYVILKILKQSEKKSVLAEQKFYLRLFCYSIISFISFYFLPFYFVIIVSKHCCTL